MRKITLVSAIAGIAIILSSCGTSNDVVSNRLISKRKYTKGFHINKKSNLKSTKGEQEEEVLAFETGKSEESKAPATSKSIISSKDAAKKVEEVAKIDLKKDAAAPSTEQNRNTAEIPAKSGDRAPATVDSRKTEKRSEIRSKKEVSRKRSKSDTSGWAASDVALILLVILAILLPPVAVILYEGATGRFWLTLVLWLVGLGLGFWLLGPGIAWACGLVAVVYALLIVLGAI